MWQLDATTLYFSEKELSIHVEVINSGRLGWVKAEVLLYRIQRLDKI